MYYWTELNCKTENERKQLERVLKKNMFYFKQEFSDDLPKFLMELTCDELEKLLEDIDNNLVVF